MSLIILKQKERDALPSKYQTKDSKHVYNDEMENITRFKFCIFCSVLILLTIDTNYIFHTIR